MISTRHWDWELIQSMAKKKIPAIADLGEAEMQTILSELLMLFIRAITPFRPSLTLREMQLVRGITPRLELHIIDLDLWLFSFDCTIAGTKLKRCMMEQQLSVVNAETEEKAKELCRDAIEQTVILTQRALFAEEIGVDLGQDAQNEGLSVDSHTKH
jgi:hypothetical protein